MVSWTAWSSWSLGWDRWPSSSCGFGGWVALWTSPPIALVSPLAAGRGLARWVGYDSIIAHSHIVLFRYIACGDVINGEYSLLPNDDDDDDGGRDSFPTSTSISHSEVSLLRTMGPLMECGEVEAEALVCFDVEGEGTATLTWTGTYSESGQTGESRTEPNGLMDRPRRPAG